MTFLDTGFLYALIDADDANHLRVRDVLERYRGRRLFDSVEVQWDLWPRWSGRWARAEARFFERIDAHQSGVRVARRGGGQTPPLGSAPGAAD